MRKAKVFYDAGNFLKRGERSLGWWKGTGRSAAVQIVKYFKGLTEQTGDALFPGEDVELAGIYWYDGAYSQSHTLYGYQKKAFSAIAAVPEITLRLGKAVEIKHPAKNYVIGQAGETLKELGHEHEGFKPLFRKNLREFKDRKQKGVDVLLVADMLTGAMAEELDIAFLVSGDGDFVDACRTARKLGCYVIVVSPDTHGFSTDLEKAANKTIMLSPQETRKMLYRRKDMGKKLGTATPKEDIAINITHRSRVAVSFGIDASASEQEKAWEYAAEQGWKVTDIAVSGHPAASLSTVAAYNIEVPLEDWRDWDNDTEGCIREMFPED